MIFCINEWQMINYLTIRTSLNKVGQCSFLYLIQPWPKDRKSFPSTIVQTKVGKQTALHCFALVTHNKTFFPITINLLCIVNLLKDISFFSFFFILFQLSLCSCIKYFLWWVGGGLWMSARMLQSRILLGPYSKGILNGSKGVTFGFSQIYML